MKLSILICSLPDRMSRASLLIEKLCLQAEGNPVEILYLGDNKSMSTGEKRNRLKGIARGEYVAFVDDDDEVSEEYVKQLLTVIDLPLKPDVINFQVMYHCRDFTRPVLYSLDYLRDQNLPDRFLRIPNHLMCIKRSLALAVQYPDVSFGEDAEYARGVWKLLKTEYQINKVLYHYLDYK